MRVVGSVLVSTTLGGCLLPGPPELAAEARVSPTIDPVGVGPDPRQIQIGTLGQTIHFTVNVHSAEADGRLIATLYQDYGPDTQTALIFRFAEPPPADAESRGIDIPWTIPVNAIDGCYQYTLLVTHLSNVDDRGAPIDPADVALVTWWFSVETDEIPNTLADCSDLGAVP